MENVFITQDLIRLVNKSYDRTTAGGSVLDAIRRNEGQRLLNVLNELPDSLNGTTLRQTSWTCSMLKTKCAAANLVREAAVFEFFSSVAKELAEERGILKRPRAYLTPEQLKVFILARETSIEKVLAFLFGKVGLSKSCIIREVHGLSRLHEGVLEIGKRLSSNVPDTRSIELKQEDLDLLKEIDPDGDCINILKDVVLKPGGYGLQSGQILDSYCASWDLSPQDLRNIHKRHLEELGLDAETRSERLGIAC